MPTYNFSQISDFEFEQLCRDLLQAELGKLLEIFAPGPDGGVDIRYLGSGGDTDDSFVGQCKRWAEDAFDKLRSHLTKEELPKIKELAPARYVLMTSVKLTRGRKNRIVNDLRPWIKAPSDVLGKHDLDGLLSKHNEVERRHIKLWLTSSEVLDALLNSDIFNRSENALDQAKRDLRLWVPNPSFDRAQEMLEANRVCIISGSPGIGKTMLANILSAGYTSQGYQLVAISDDIEEGERVWRSNARQLFLYDDFLGHVTYGELHLRKNEQSRLASFLNRVRESENKRFILTTREYIISEALRRYERFSDIELETFKELITLEDYTLPIRARILYNHLFFSELPSNLKTALLPEERYWGALRHRNYNPRVIEHAVNLPGVASLSPTEFVANIFATLDDPAKVWERIYENLPQIARRVLAVLGSLPTEVFLEDVREAVKSLAPREFDGGEFRNAIGLIEGTFVDLKEASPGTDSRQRLVVIRDPSVRDYLWSRLERVEDEAEALLEAAVFFEQCVILFEGKTHANSVSARFSPKAAVRSRDRQIVNPGAVVIKAIELIQSTSPVVTIWMDDDAGYYDRESISLERRVAFLVAMLAAHRTDQAVSECAIKGLTTMIEAWEEGRGKPKEAVELLGKIATIEDSVDENLLHRMDRALLGLVTHRPRSTEDFEALVALSSLKPDTFMEPERGLKSYRSDFRTFLEGERYWLLEEIPDRDWLKEEVRRIGRIASVLGLDVSDFEEDAERRMEELPTDWEPDIDALMPHLDSNPGEEPDLGEIDALFQSLRQT